MFQRAAEGKRGEAALDAMGEAYMELLDDRVRLRARCRPTPRATTPRSARSSANGYGDLVAYVGASPDCRRRRSSAFFAAGMLLNVIASMDVQEGAGAVGGAAARGLRQE